MKIVLFAALATGFLASSLLAAEPIATTALLQVVPAPSSGIGYLTPYHAPRYAYGWFGAQSRKSWYRHFGYYRDYTQWKVK